MKKVFSEIGFGNNTFLSTEFEEGNDEYRVSRFILPNKIIGFYFRFWLFKKVFILSSNHGFEITKKDKNKLKILFGISGETKTLKFTPQLVDKILSGQKSSTWRLFDDKNLMVGDKLIFVNKETLMNFGEAVITSLKIKTLGSLTDDDWIGHEKFSSEEEMCTSYKKYYGDRVNKNSEVKILTFDFTMNI